MPIALLMSSSPSSAPSNGARLVSSQGRELPLQETHLRAEAGGGIARTVVEQRFENPHDEPLRVTYSLPLPADGAVSGFAFRIGDQRIEGEVQKRADARAAFEQAIVEGRSAAILEQERTSVFTQEIGNIPPRASIVAEITVDQPLSWLDEGAWEWRFPTVVAPRYMGESGRVPDAARLSQDVADGPTGARFTLETAILDAIPAGKKPESPSHAVSIESAEEPRFASYRVGASKSGQGTFVRVGRGARLDRDIVVRWPVATPQVGASLLVGRPPVRADHGACGYGLLTIVPPELGAGGAAIGRDLIVLIDTSGSMGGEPLDQARRVVAAMIDTLGEGDQIEMIEFSSRVRRFKSAPIAANKKGKKEALEWLRCLVASGGTEMKEGIVAALTGVRADTQRQVVVVTDGQIGFETDVISAICDGLPRSSRLHMVGVGSAVNRSLTGPAARAGRGVEVVIGLGEDPERAAQRLVRATDRPLVVDLDLSGSAVIEVAPRKLPDLFARRPAVVAVSLDERGGDLLVRGRTARGPFEHRISVPAIAPESGSRAAVTLFGRFAVEDAELALAAGQSRELTDRRVERVGLDFQIATRLTSWVALTKQRTVDPERGSRRVQQPQELPHGMSAEGVGLREQVLVFGLEGALGEMEEEASYFADPGTLAGPAQAELPKAAPARAPARIGAAEKPRGPVDLKARLGSTSAPRPARGPFVGPSPQPIVGPVPWPTAGPAPAPASAGDRLSAPIAGPVAGPVSPVAPLSSAERASQIGSSGLSVGAPKSRKSPLGPVPVLAGLIAFAIAYYFLRSWWMALFISWVVTGLVIALRSLAR
ncbi:MAG: VIT domain-containing protein [Polyangiaceae bacterium]